MVPDRMGAIVGWRSWRIDRSGYLYSVEIADSEERAKSGQKITWPRGGPCTTIRWPRIPRYLEAKHFTPSWRVRAKGNVFYQEYNEEALHTQADCMCGFYAYKSLWVEHHLGTSYFKSEMYYALGPVLLWGVVQVHAKGYRAQYARPAGPVWLHRYVFEALPNAAELFSTTSGVTVMGDHDDMQNKKPWLEPDD